MVGKAPVPEDAPIGIVVERPEVVQFAEVAVLYLTPRRERFIITDLFWNCHAEGHSCTPERRRGTWVSSIAQTGSKKGCSADVNGLGFGRSASGTGVQGTTPSAPGVGGSSA